VTGDNRAKNRHKFKRSSVAVRELSSVIMVDSCFKLFRKSRCVSRSSSSSSHCGSFESLYLNENNNKRCFKATAVVNKKYCEKYDDDNIITDISDLIEDDSGVVLRRHNRKYLTSFSSVSNDALSSDDDENKETLDILYPLPLPHVNAHERSLVDDAKRCDNNGTIINYAIHKFRSDRA
jgi:hypothetical protein